MNAQALMLPLVRSFVHCFTAPGFAPFTHFVLAHMALRGTHWTFTASGPVTNLAARLAGVAEAGQILVGPETAQRLGDRYHLEQLGRKYLKNIAEAIEIHRVMGRSVLT